MFNFVGLTNEYMCRETTFVTDFSSNNLQVKALSTYRKPENRKLPIRKLYVSEFDYVNLLIFAWIANQAKRFSSLRIIFLSYTSLMYHE